jgi:hypothetical protein
MYEILDKYTQKKTRGKVSTQVTDDGQLVVSKVLYDDEGNLLTDRKVICVTSPEQLSARLAELQNEKQIINQFVAAESIILP